MRSPAIDTDVAKESPCLPIVVPFALRQQPRRQAQPNDQLAAQAALAAVAFVRADALLQRLRECVPACRPADRNAQHEQAYTLLCCTARRPWEQGNAAMGRPAQATHRCERSRCRASACLAPRSCRLRGSPAGGRSHQVLRSATSSSRASEDAMTRCQPQGKGLRAQRCSLPAGQVAAAAAAVCG